MKSPGGEKQRAKQEHININHTSDLVTHFKKEDFDLLLLLFCS